MSDVETVARALARHNVLRNAPWDRDLTEDFIAQAVEGEWKDFVEQAQIALAAIKGSEPVSLAETNAARRAIYQMLRPGKGGEESKG